MVCFEGDQVKDKTIIFFSPHPDDETFGCGGTIAKKLSEGFEVFVVIMTDGRYSYSKVLGIFSNPTPEELATTRKAEVEKATGILGLKKENLIFLDFEDGSLEQKEYEAQKLVTEILLDHLPIEVYFTHNKDGHIDHRATSRIVKSSIKKMKIQPKQYEYFIWSRSGPYGRLQGLQLLNQDRLAIDISAFLPLKERAISQFRSQISVMFERQGRPIVKDTARFLKNKETFFVCR